MNLMHVIFDKNGDIHNIDPNFSEPSNGLISHPFLLSEVDDLISGKRDPFDYYVKATKDPTSYKINKKITSIKNYVRTLDYFLTEVPVVSSSKNVSILVENIVKERKIKISLGPGLEKICENPETDEQECLVNSLKQSSHISLFFTTKKDPYDLLYTYTFIPNTLVIHKELYIDYSANLSNSSLYTRKLISDYGYMIKE